MKYVFEKSGSQHPTLSDVARDAKVSVSTAARVLRGSTYPVAHELQERVRKAAEKVGYVPNLLAKKLRGGEHSSIGLIVGNMMDPYFGAIAQTVSVAAHNRSLLAVVANMQRDPQLELAMIRQLWEHRVNGLVLAGGGFDQMTFGKDLVELVEQLKRAGIVVVTVAEREIPVPVFSVDNVLVGAMLAEHALQHGHSQIGISAGPIHSYVTQRRLKGSLKVLARAGIKPAVVNTEFGVEGGINAVNALLEQNPKLTMILANADTLGVGIIQGLAMKGLSVPGDVSIVGAGATAYAALCNPVLTTMDLDLAACCKAAVEYVGECLAGSRPSMPKTITPHMVSGKSVRTLPPRNS
jgi:LacI family transcriptional regulator